MTEEELIEEGFERIDILIEESGDAPVPPS